jgi:hypothetical protein
MKYYAHVDFWPLAWKELRIKYIIFHQMLSNVFQQQYNMSTLFFIKVQFSSTLFWTCELQLSKWDLNRLGLFYIQNI